MHLSKILGVHAPEHTWVVVKPRKLHQCATLQVLQKLKPYTLQLKTTYSAKIAVVPLQKLQTCICTIDMFINTLFMNLTASKCGTEACSTTPGYLSYQNLGFASGW